MNLRRVYAVCVSVTLATLGFGLVDLVTLESVSIITAISMLLVASGVIIGSLALGDMLDLLSDYRRDTSSKRLGR